jgi:pantothenate kinase
MFQSTLIKSSSWLLGAALTLSLAATATAAVCARSSRNFDSTLVAVNQPSLVCAGNAETKIKITVTNTLLGGSFTTGQITRCALSTAPISFSAVGGSHRFETANGGVWGAVGAGLCSFYSYTAG